MEIAVFALFSKLFSNWDQPTRMLLKLWEKLLEVYDNCRYVFTGSRQEGSSHAGVLVVKSRKQWTGVV